MRLIKVLNNREIRCEKHHFKNMKFKPPRKWLTATFGSALLTTALLFTVSPGLRNDYHRAATGIDLALQDDIIDVKGRSVLVPFQFALDNGYMPDTGLHPSNYYTYNIHADDHFGRAYRQVLDDVKEQIGRNTTLGALLNKTHWDRDDRIEWERNITGIINYTIDNVDGLGTYRTTGDDKDVTRDTNLNNLSFDIRDDSQRYEYDCEAMAIVEGLLLQEIENHYLPHTASDDDNLKRRASYHYVAGRLSQNDSDKLDVWHAYIMSDLTASIIEATHNPASIFHGKSAYKTSANADMTFDDFVNGEIFVEGTEYRVGSSVYGFDITEEEAKQARENAKERRQQEDKIAEARPSILNKNKPG